MIKRENVLNKTCENLIFRFPSQALSANGWIYWWTLHQCEVTSPAIVIQSQLWMQDRGTRIVEESF
jgi:hypothetical protein